MFKEEEDMRIVTRLNENIEMINKRSEKNLMIPIKILAVQGEALALGLRNKPIYCKIEGLKKDENEGSLISNGDYVLYVEEVSDSGFTKLSLFGAGYDESIARNEFEKDFFILC